MGSSIRRLFLLTALDRSKTPIDAARLLGWGDGRRGRPLLHHGLRDDLLCPLAAAMGVLDQLEEPVTILVVEAQ